MMFVKQGFLSSISSKQNGSLCPTYVITVKEYSDAEDNVADISIMATCVILIGARLYLIMLMTS